MRRGRRSEKFVNSLMSGLIAMVLAITPLILMGMQNKALAQDDVVAFKTLDMTGEVVASSIVMPEVKEVKEVTDKDFDTIRFQFIKKKADSRYKISDQRIKELIAWCHKYGDLAKLDINMMIAIMTHESKFVNGPSDFKDEDSDGYVQMQSITREWLRTQVDNDLPKFNSQEDFRKDPESQVRYMAAFLRFSNFRYDRNFDVVVSSYNVGPTNTDKKIYNKDYVEKVKGYKYELDKLCQ